MPHSFPGFEGLRRFARSYQRKRTMCRGDDPLVPAPRPLTRAKRVLVVGTRDIASAVALSARIRSCGFPVILTVEALDIRDSLNLNPDLVVVQVHQGRELRAYYAGRVTAERGIATLFVAPNLRTAAIEALRGALPICILLDYFCSNMELTAAVNEFQDNAVR